MTIKTLVWAALAGGFAILGCEDIGEGLDGAGPPTGIVNGEDIGYQSWRGVVTVYALPTDTSCTGTLIAKDLVLTAGHCVYSKQYGIDFRGEPQKLAVWAGADVYDTAARIDYGKADRLQVHPDWDGKDHSSDLALVRLADPIEDSRVEVYGLRAEPEPEVGDEAVIVGYGRAKDSDPQSSGPQRMGKTAVRAIRIRPALGKHSMIRLQRDSLACTGDSGGPVFTEQGGGWVVTGVASMSDCFNDNANVNLLNHKDWLDRSIAEMSRFAGAEDEVTDESDEDTGGSPEGTDAAGPGDIDAIDELGRAGDSGCDLAPTNPGVGLDFFFKLLS